jgi:DNA-binding response OmpR family regulator
MDKILIVDEDQNLLKSLKTGLDKMRQFEVITALDFDTATRFLSQNRIAVLVTAIDAPRIDGLELVAYMTSHHPATPIIIMTDYGKPWFHDHSTRSDFLYHIEKPFKIKSLASAIFVGLTLRDEGSNFNGLAMTHLLPIIEAQQKSCKVKVLGRNRAKGYLYFDEGILINAHYQDLSGDKAAKEMIQWNNLTIEFTDLPRRRGRKRVKTSLMDLIGASWQKEEVVNDSIEEKPAPQTKNKKDPAQLISQELKTSIKELNTIAGFIAVGILNTKGEILDFYTADYTIDFQDLVNSFNHAFSVSTAQNFQNKSSLSHAFTVHTQKSILLTLMFKLSKKEFYIVGITAPGGNWYFMQHKLEQLKQKLVEKIS